MTPEQREPLDALSRLLLDFHKVLLDWERANYEAKQGRIGSPGEFLGLVLDHAQFAWLRQLSGLIVEIDEALAPRSKAGAEMPDLLLAQCRRLLCEAVENSADAARMRAEVVNQMA